ncbi:MAG: hypothetical protein HY865_02100 [Chloroflexi bacterium]|nr:hypothetical protein [Chloroflexota bacterium]
MSIQSTTSPIIINSEPFDDHSPLDEARIRKELMRGNIVDVDPLDEVIVDAIPMAETVTHKALIDTSVGALAALLDRNVSEDLRARWNEVQGGFVDEPRSAVQQADALVSEVVEKITRMFASEHGSLESQWKQGNDVTTEDLRRALQHYRSFFNRLVA